ncbi:MAG: hypothetical protein JWN45_1751 [Acidobacteriaceae bacterium]|nr:hypothetical protein [Acidobacteriaceae bacterium]
MKRIGLALVLVLSVAVMGNVAAADVITFSTSGLFSSGAATSGDGTFQITFGTGSDTATLRFTGLAPVSYGIDAAHPSVGVGLGFFDIAATGAGATASGTFTLTISQTSPNSGTGDLGGIISGSFSIISGVGGGNGLVNFNPNSTNIGGISYVLNNGTNDTNVIQLNAAGSPAGTFGRQSSVEALASVPEPASVALFGSGLLMGGNFIRRKFKV